jgi:hypothetical protein
MCNKIYGNIVFIIYTSLPFSGLRYVFKLLKIKTKYKNPSHVGLEIKTKNKNPTYLALFFKSIV